MRFSAAFPIADFLVAQLGLFRQLNALIRREGVAMVLANDLSISV